MSSHSFPGPYVHSAQSNHTYLPTPAGKAVAYGGFYLANFRTGAVSGSFYALVAQEDTLFTAFDVDNVTGLVTYNLSGSVATSNSTVYGYRTVKAGSYLGVEEDKAITAFNLISGSVLAYYKK